MTLRHGSPCHSLSTIRLEGICKPEHPQYWPKHGGGEKSKKKKKQPPAPAAGASVLAPLASDGDLRAQTGEGGEDGEQQEEEQQGEEFEGQEGDGELSWDPKKYSIFTSAGVDDQDEDDEDEGDGEDG